MLERDPIYRGTVERLKALGVEGVLFDLDDTLIYTSEIFIRWMEEYSEKVGDEIGVDPSEIMRILQEINDEEYKRMGVNPTRWTAVVEQMADHFPGHEEVIRGNLEILMNIYTTVPRTREGARILLDILKKSGIKVGLVTHANVDWTNFKLDQLGLWDCFDQVYIVDENGHKKSLDWKNAAERMGVDPGKCIFVGDSLGGDIRPGDELGARTVYLPSPWSVYRQGSVPEKTVTIGEIFGFVEALEKLE